MSNIEKVEEAAEGLSPLEKIKRKAEEAKQRKVEQERLVKETSIQEKIENKKQLFEQTEKQEESLKEVKELLQEVENGLETAQDNLAKVSADLEEAEGILQEYLGVIQGLEETEEVKQEKEDMEKMIEEMRQSLQDLEKQKVELEEKREKIVQQIEELSEKIKEKEKVLEELEKDPELVEYLQEKLKKEDEEQEKKIKEVNIEIEKTREEIEKTAENIFKEIQEAIGGQVQGREMIKFSEKLVREARKNITEEFFDYDYWKKGGEEFVGDANKIFENSNSPDEFIKELKKLTEKGGQYGGIMNGKQKKAVEIALSIMDTNDYIRKWEEGVRSKENFKDADQVPEEKIEELSLEYANLMKMAWDVKRSFSGHKEAQRLPVEAHYLLNRKLEEFQKRNTDYPRSDIKGILQTIQNQAGGREIVYNDPLEKESKE